ncbi:hypothetical protein JB92DRAFT_3121805 [Gautieria morchelliformis]|nr:hypothetical protein JB92DRAFT_3121805 [Gautieria morchelliformis]
MSQRERGRRGPGRPALKWYPRGRQSRLFSTSTQIPASPQSPTSALTQAEMTEPNDSTLTPDELRILHIQKQHTRIPPLTLFSKNIVQPLFLDSIAHSPPEWKYLGKVPTESLPDWFDSQHNDFNAHKSLPTRAVALKWFGHPGDMPVDVRA